MYTFSRKIFKLSGGSDTRVYVNFDHPFKKEYEHSDIKLIQHANSVYEVKNRTIMKNRYKVVLTDELLEQINDVLMIDEL